MVLTLTAFGSAPALAATTQHGVVHAATQASRPAHVARMSAAPLLPGGRLKSGAFLDSGTVTLVMQSDGNLVLYRDGHVGDPNWALWASGTMGHNTAVMQGDGNFVIYPSNGVGHAGLALWATHTSGNNVLEVQNDGQRGDLPVLLHRFRARSPMGDPHQDLTAPWVRFSRGQ